MDFSLTFIIIKPMVTEIINQDGKNDTLVSDPNFRLNGQTTRARSRSTVDTARGNKGGKTSPKVAPEQSRKDAFKQPIKLVPIEPLSSPDEDPVISTERQRFRQRHQSRLEWSAVGVMTPVLAILVLVSSQLRRDGFTPEPLRQRQSNTQQIPPAIANNRTSPPENQTLSQPDMTDPDEPVQKMRSGEVGKNIQTINTAVRTGLDVVAFTSGRDVSSFKPDTAIKARAAILHGIAEPAANDLEAETNADRYARYVEGQKDRMTQLAVNVATDEEAEYQLVETEEEAVPVGSTDGEAVQRSFIKQGITDINIWTQSVWRVLAGGVRGKIQYVSNWKERAELTAKTDKTGRVYVTDLTPEELAQEVDALVLKVKSKDLAAASFLDTLIREHTQDQAMATLILEAVYKDSSADAAEVVTKLLNDDLQEIFNIRPAGTLKVPHNWRLALANENYRLVMSLGDYKVTTPFPST